MAFTGPPWPTRLPLDALRRSFAAGDASVTPVCPVSRAGEEAGGDWILEPGSAPASGFGLVIDARAKTAMAQPEANLAFLSKTRLITQVPGKTCGLSSPSGTQFPVIVVPVFPLKCLN